MEGGGWLPFQQEGGETEARGGLECERPGTSLKAAGSSQREGHWVTSKPEPSESPCGGRSPTNRSSIEQWQAVLTPRKEPGGGQVSTCRTSLVTVPGWPEPRGLYICTVPLDLSQSLQAL
jgi:hypothetical protein